MKPTRGHFETFALWLLVSSPLWAQAPGVLRGRIVDPSGAFVPSASVNVTGPNDAVHAAQSDQAGAFSLLGLAPGEYTIRAASPGFGLFETTLNLPGGRVTTLDIHLQVAADRQEVTVAEQQQVSVDPASNAGAIVMKGEDLDMLSNNTDDLQAELLALAGPAAGPNGGQIFIDGFSNGQLPPKESIREIRINSNPFSAEFERSGNGRIEIFTRPGADRFRGSAQYNFADNALNARNPFSPTKPPFRSRQWNVNLRGPLSKKSSFNFEVGRNVQQDTNFINALVLDQDFAPVRLTENAYNPNLRTYFSPRIDYALTPNVTLQGRYTIQRNHGINNGVGDFTLLSRANRTENLQQSVQVTETAVLGARAVNETRFQYSRQRNNTRGDASTPTIRVLDAFTGGGANAPWNYTHGDNYEFQNNTSYTRGRHFVRFGARLRGNSQNSYSTSNYNGTYTFTSITAYAATLRGLEQGLSIAEIRAQGGGARQYSVTGGTPLASVTQVDVAPFVQEDWRVRPNFTLSLGLRYEIQTNIADRRAVAPRIGVAWGLGRTNGRTAPRTVLRAGFGMFYERFGIGQTLQTIRQNGINQQNFVVIEPLFFPVAPPVDQLLANRQPQAIYRTDSSLVAPTIYQGALTLERQLPKNVTLSINYTNSRGVHQLRSRNINAPLPNTFSGAAGTGVYPFGSSGQLFLYESSAVFKQSQLSFTLNARVNPRIQMFGYYAYGRAFADSDGAGSFPANNYDLATEWGRAGFDIRHRVQLGGNFSWLPFGFRLSPNVNWQSAPPINITSGLDLNGDTNFNDRPALATDLSRPSVRVTPWGAFDINPLPGQQIIPRNFGTAFARLDVSGRLSRTWSFGERATGNNRAGNAAQSGNRGGGGGDRGGGGGGNGRYNLTLSIQSRNAINTTNPAAPNGNLSSPLFGQSLNLNGGGSTANRRLELNVRIEF